MNKISIICPVWNAEKTIEQTIESVATQTSRDWELILVNDKSTDDTRKVIKANKYFQLFVGEQSPHMSLYDTEDIHDKGIVAALNYGISKASGEFIARIDADDLMMPDRLELQLRAFTDFPQLNLVAGDAIIIDESGNELQNQLVSTNNLTDLDERCCIVHPSVMWRKSYFDANNLIYNREFEYAEDYDLWLRFRKTVSPVYAKITKPIIKYRVSTNSISSKYNTTQKTLTRRLLKEHNIRPYVSIINMRPDDKLADEIQKQNYTNYEIVSNLDDADGQYICFSCTGANGYEDTIDRINKQVLFLKQNPEFVGCGTYIQKKDGVFFYAQNDILVEAELLKGHMIIEPMTFMMKNCPDSYYYLNKRDPDFFELYCNLLKFGKLCNIALPLVKKNDYEVIKHTALTNRMKYAKETYKNIINVIQLNITSDGNFSGVDRYLKIIEDNAPTNVRITRITFVASDHIEWKLHQKHIVIFYNPKATKLESMFDMFWDNLQQHFIKPNLIVQSNCLNLYSLITYLRRKTRLIHICAMHCVPYREVIRMDRNKYAQLEDLFKDDTKDFPETPDHLMPINQADWVILNTKDSEEYYNRVGYTTPYSVIYNGVEQINKFESKKVHTPFRWIFVGHSSPLKGTDQLISIIEELSKKIQMEVHWVGSADPRLVDTIKAKKIPIISYGVIHPDKLNSLYKEMDGVLIASACETCSYAAIEGLAANLPIVATNTHGVKEIVENVGLLVDIDKAGAINRGMYMDAMSKVMTDEKLRERIYKRTEERYNLYHAKEMANKIVELYKKLLWI